MLVQYRQIGAPFKFVGPPAIAQKPMLDLAKEAAEGYHRVCGFRARDGTRRTGSSSRLTERNTTPSRIHRHPGAMTP